MLELGLLITSGFHGLNICGSKRCLAQPKNCHRFNVITSQSHRMCSAVSTFLTEPTFVGCNKTHLMNVELRGQWPVRWPVRVLSSGLLSSIKDSTFTASGVMSRLALSETRGCNLLKWDFLPLPEIVNNEYLPFVRVDNDSSRSLQILEQSSPVGDVPCAEDVQSTFATVDVVQVLSHPVHGQSFDSLVLRR